MKVCKSSGKIILLVTVSVVSFGILISCADERPGAIINVRAVRSVPEQTIYALEPNTTTVGNNSYVAINLVGNPDQYRKEILELLQKFEEINPDLKVVHW